MRRLVSRMVLAVLVTAFALIVFTFAKRPRTDRTWESGLERTATFALHGDGRFEVRNLRAFAFGEDGAVETAWTSATGTMADLKEIWFFIEPFAGNDTFAHSFLSFVFVGETRRVLSISVEARKEVGEDYSALAGLFRAYELSYVWSTEKDILTRIALDLGHPLLAYRLDLPEEGARKILAHFIARTNELAAAPRFYNTLHSNCTNELAKAVNRAYPGSLPWHPSFVLTGRSAGHLHRLGYVAPEAQPFTEIAARADIAGLVARHRALEAEAFARAWREDFTTRTERMP